MDASYFEDKLIIVTGGSSGIGKTLAQKLAKADAHVWIWARREVPLQDTLATLEGRGNHGYHSVDVSKREEIENALERVQREAGTPDIIFNNAGISKPGYIEEIAIETFERLTAVNYLGTVYLTQLVLPGMLERGSGHIVNISSMAGFLGVFGYSAYCPTKFAVRGYSDVLRSEMKYRGIKVSVVFPPDTDTPMLEDENNLKPFETREISDSGGLLSTEQVTEEILAGVARNKYLILPGFNNKFFFWLNNALGRLIYTLMDFMVAQALRKKKKVGR